MNKILLTNIPTLILIIVSIILSGCTNTVDLTQNDTLAPTTLSPDTLSRDTLNYIEQTQYRKAKEALAVGKLDQAESLLEALSKRKPNFSGAWANLALIYYKKNLFEKAKFSAQKAKPQNAQLANLLGLISVEQGKYEIAETYYKTSLKYDKNYSNAHYNLALLYDVYYQEIGKAIVHYKRYLELSDTKDKSTVDWLEQLKSSLTTGYEG